MLTQIYNDVISKDDKRTRKQLPIITFISKIAKHILNACCFKDLESETIQNKQFLMELIPLATNFINNVFGKWMVNFVNELNKPHQAMYKTEYLISIIDKFITDNFKSFYQNQDNLNRLKSLYEKYKISD